MTHRSATPSGKTRYECRGYENGEKWYCYSTVNPDVPYRDQKCEAKKADERPQFKRKLSGIKRFIITAAQNGTPPCA